MSLSAHDLSIIGASLYLCEGTKSRIDNRGYKQFSVEFTNKDPRAIEIFLDFLRKVIKVDEDRVKAELFIYPDLDGSKLLKYWSSVTKIPIIRFNKTICLPQKNGKFRPNPLGTLKIRYGHKEHFLKIQDIIVKVFGKEV